MRAINKRRLRLEIDTPGAWRSWYKSDNQIFILTSIFLPSKTAININRSNTVLSRHTPPASSSLLHSSLFVLLKAPSSIASIAAFQDRSCGVTAILRSKLSGLLMLLKRSSVS